jgi:lipid A oxidase
MRTSLGNPRAGALLFWAWAKASDRPIEATIGAMRAPESSLRQSLISLTTGLLLAATMATLGGEIRLRLPFDILPGAAYLALLSFPAIWREAGRGDDGADLQLGAYGGTAYTGESDLNLVQPGGTDMTFRNIAWEGRPFRRPPYYGYRAIYWPSDRYGVMLDFTHIKAIANKDRPVQQSGFKDGDHVPPQAPVSATLKRLEFTHGYNLLTLNALRRGALRGPNLIAYAGLGLGVAIPHVEVERADKSRSDRTFEYQITGPALQLLGGIERRFGRRLSLFVEYKLSCAMLRGDLVGGGKVTTNLCTHQLLGGPAVHLRARDAIPASP